jgi:hypothetical protein
MITQRQALEIAELVEYSILVVGEITMDEVCSAIYTIAKIRPLLTQ